MAAYVKALQRYRLRVLLLWFALAAVLGLVGAVKLLALTKNEFNPPEGSPSQVAHSKLEQYFGDAEVGQEVIYFEAHPEKSIFDQDLLQSVTDACGDYLRGHLDDDLFQALECQGYYLLLKKGPPFEAGAPSFVGAGNLSSFLIFEFPRDNAQKYGQTFENLCIYIRSEFPELAFVGNTGLAAVDVEAVKAATKSIELMDTVSLPIAFLILALSLRSLRLLLVPLLTLMLSIVVSFGILGVIARSGMLISSSAPPVMMSMLLAVSIDYALFLLARFQEERKRGLEMPVAVERMIRYSGHTICCSGFTLAFCFLSLLSFPLSVLQSIGIGVIISIMVAILTNLTVVPACLLCMPSFFSKQGCCRPSAPDSVGAGAGGAPTGASRWDRWARMATSTPAFFCVVLMMIVVGSLGLARFCRLEKSVDTFLMTPRGALTTVTSERFGRSFSEGQTGPYKLLLLPSGASTIYAEDFWGNATQLLQDVVGIFDNKSKAHGTVQSVAFQYDPKLTFAEFGVPMVFARLLDPSLHEPDLCLLIPDFLPLKAECEEFERKKSCTAFAPLANATGSLFGIPAQRLLETCGLFQLQFTTNVAPRRDALIATLMPSQTPGSKESVDWARKCRELLGTGRYPALEAHLDGMNAGIMDAIDAIYARVPLVLAITMVSCLVFIGFFTVSVAFAVSSVMLIAWTMVVVYGFGVAIYQESLMGPWAPASVSNTGGLAWLVLPLTFTVVLGLGLDYDIFLLGRVCEYRCQGLGDRAAIANGVARTGPVITSAGIIMAIAFSGLMMSDVPMLNQMALLLVTAVLIDTFFIRSLATPAIHAPLGHLNWWPRKVPAAGQAAALDVIAAEDGMDAQLCAPVDPG